MARQYGRLVLGAMLGCVGSLLLPPAGASAAKLTCLMGTDPSTAGDISQIATVRAAVDTTCPCASFDASSGKTHAAYVKCAKAVVATSVSGGSLRKQCAGTVTKDYATSICGIPSARGVVPCIAKSASGQVTCAIKSSAQCSGVACPGFTTCIDAVDTNGDGLIGAGDSGSCTFGRDPLSTLGLWVEIDRRESRAGYFPGQLIPKLQSVRRGGGKPGVGRGLATTRQNEGDGRGAHYVRIAQRGSNVQARSRLHLFASDLSSRLWVGPGLAAAHASRVEQPQEFFRSFREQANEGRSPPHNPAYGGDATDQLTDMARHDFRHAPRASSSRTHSVWR